MTFHVNIAGSTHLYLDRYLYGVVDGKIVFYTADVFERPFQRQMHLLAQKNQFLTNAVDGFMGTSVLRGVRADDPLNAVGSLGRSLVFAPYMQGVKLFYSEKKYQQCIGKALMLGMEIVLQIFSLLGALPKVFLRCVDAVYAGFYVGTQQKL